MFISLVAKKRTKETTADKILALKNIIISYNA